MHESPINTFQFGEEESRVAPRVTRKHFQTQARAASSALACRGGGVRGGGGALPGPRVADVLLSFTDKHDSKQAAAGQPPLRLGGSRPE